MKVVLAVSGGVDSVVMLDAISRQSVEFNMGLEIIVAHFDHGIRGDSDADARFVRALADQYGLGFELGNAQLGSEASEATARKVRWEFLTKVRKKHDAVCVITAHHADDVLETIIINLLRGTGRRGLSVLGNTETIVRPLIKNTKAEIYEYTLKHNLEFVEDSTNADDRFLRNRIRRVYIPKLGENLSQLKSLIQSVDTDNDEIDRLVQEIFDATVETQNDQIKLAREFLADLPEPVARELLREAIELIGVIHDKQKLSADMLERLLEFSNRTDAKKLMHLSKHLHAKIDKTSLVIHRVS